MRIAIVGYGSLIWDLDNLAPHVTGQWSLGTGPKMPVEFSRISPKRKMGLVLVVDQTLNHQCQTNIIESSRSNLQHTINDLAARERCDAEMIGHLDMNGNGLHGFSYVEEWLERSSFDGVVWTALPGNYHSHTGRAFSHHNARDYLRTLKRDALVEAWRYIEFAPEVTATPFRQFLAEDPFWQSLDFGDQFIEARHEA